MELIWKVTTVGETNQAGEKLLCCETKSISEVVVRFQLELLSRLGSPKNRALARFRKYFEDRQPNTGADAFSWVVVDSYWEDADGRQIEASEARERLFRIPPRSLILQSTKPHDIAWQIAVAEKENLFGPAGIKPSEHQTYVLRSFTRDAWVLKNSRFLSGTAFSLSRTEGEPLRLEVSDDENVHHYLAVFRRLYGHNEPANYECACNAVAMLAPETAFATWLAAERKSVARYLSKPAHFWPLQKKLTSFNVSQLISNFMYGRFLHQSEVEHEQQRAEWSREAGSVDLLEATFYQATLQLGCHFVNWGQWTARFCRHHGVELTIDTQGNTIRDPHVGRDTRLDQLSTEQRSHFDTLAAELASHLRATTNGNRFDLCLKAARDSLLDVL